MQRPAVPKSVSFTVDLPFADFRPGAVEGADFGGITDILFDWCADGGRLEDGFRELDSRQDQGKPWHAADGIRLAGHFKRKSSFAVRLDVLRGGLYWTSFSFW